jgi:hypothetical protein
MGDDRLLQVGDEVLNHCSSRMSRMLPEMSEYY